MTFGELYKELLKNKQTLNYVSELLSDPKNHLQQALFTLFTALIFNEKINV